MIIRERNYKTRVASSVKHSASSSLVKQYIGKDYATQLSEEEYYRSLEKFIDNPENAHLLEKPKAELKNAMIKYLLEKSSMHPKQIEPIIPIIIDHYLEYRK